VLLALHASYDEVSRSRSISIEVALCIAARSRERDALVEAVIQRCSRRRGIVCCLGAFGLRISGSRSDHGGRKRGCGGGKYEAHDGSPLEARSKAMGRYRHQLYSSIMRTEILPAEMCYNDISWFR
jgi:hypothetical protein